MSDFLPIPPTHAIKDAQIRAVLDALVQNTDIAQATFVSENQARQAAIGAIRDVLGTEVPSGDRDAMDAITAISGQIARSLIFRKLGEKITIDLSGFQSVAAGITEETEIRIEKDYALASAINNIWASIGGSTAVIEDGALAAASPSAATATKWNSVVSAVTDPNTGNVASAAILQETRTYASNNDSTLNAIYSVRAQLSSGGQTVVGGFGLAATAGAGSSAGPTIDFGVLANKFFIAAPSGTGYDPNLEYTTNLSFPFIVITTPTTINGVTYAAGVYMKKAIIGEASIDTAKIAQHINSNNFNGTFDGSGNILTNGTLGWALDKSGKFVINSVYARGDIQASSLTANSVNTDNINGEAVTVSRYVDSSATVSIPSGATWGAGLTTSAMNSKGAPVIFTVYFEGVCGTTFGGDVDSGYSEVQFRVIRVGAGVEASGVIVRPTSQGQCTVACRTTTSTMDPWQYTVEFNTNLSGGQAFYRGLHVTTFIR